MVLDMHIAQGEKHKGSEGHIFRCFMVSHIGAEEPVLYFGMVGSS